MEEEGEEKEEEEDYLSDDAAGGALRAPLLSKQSTDVETTTTRSSKKGSNSGIQGHSTSMTGGGGETASTMGIGGWWQLAWKWTDKVGPDGVKRDGVKRMYLHEEEGAEAGDCVHAATLVSRSILCTKGRADRTEPDPGVREPAGDGGGGQ